MLYPVPIIFFYSYIYTERNKSRPKVLWIRYGFLSGISRIRKKCFGKLAKLFSTVRVKILFGLWRKLSFQAQKARQTFCLGLFLIPFTTFLCYFFYQNSNDTEKERKDKTSFTFIITCSLSRMKALLSLAYLATK